MTDNYYKSKLKRRVQSLSRDREALKTEVREAYPFGEAVKWSSLCDPPVFCEGTVAGWNGESVLVRLSDGGIKHVHFSDIINEPEPKEGEE